MTFRTIAIRSPLVNVSSGFCRLVMAASAWIIYSIALICGLLWTSFIFYLHIIPLRSGETFSHYLSFLSFLGTGSSSKNWISSLYASSFLLASSILPSPSRSVSGSLSMVSFIPSRYRWPRIFVLQSSWFHVTSEVQSMPPVSYILPGSITCCCNHI